jgi:hypothetical protein
MLPTLVVQVPDGVTTPNLEVRVNGEILPRDRWDAPLPVDPGRHDLEVIAPPRPKQTASLTVGPKADRVTWTATLQASEVPARATPRRPSRCSPPPDTRGPARSSSGSSTASTLALVSGGAGLGGLLLGTISGVVSLGAHSSLVGRCPTYPVCSPADRGALDTLNDRALTSGSHSDRGFARAQTRGAPPESVE